MGNDSILDQDKMHEDMLPTSSRIKDFITLYSKNHLAVIGFFIFLAIIVLCVGAPLFAKYNPELDMDTKAMLLPPGSEGHILGTDDYGRDIFTRLLYGGRSSVINGVAVAVFSAVIGVVIGCISGFFGGMVDSILMRITDMLMSFPTLVIAVALSAVLGAGQSNVIIVLAALGWPVFARLTKGEVVCIREQEYIESAKIAGFSNIRIMFLHILPNCLAPLIVQLTLSVGYAILWASSLYFLGLGGNSLTPDWGVMINQGKNYLQSAPYLTTIPGIAISLTVLSINWMGDGLRDAIDPRMRK